MARKQARPPATDSITLEPLQTTCCACGSRMRMARHSHRTVTTLQGVTHLTLQVYRCRNTTCPRFHQATRPEEEGRWAVPHGEFGLDVIALVGTLRYQQQRSIPQIHEELLRRGLQVAQRTVTDQLYRYEELLALHLADSQRLQERLREQKQVILALDELQPDVGHEVLWVLRDCCSGEVLVARSLLGATENDLVPLLEEAASICRKLDIPIAGVITDGQRSIRNAVARALPGIPHQLCHFHYLREAAKPISDADRHAKKELKKQVRGVRPLERALEGRADAEAEAVRGYCLAVRSALTDDGQPPLDADGLQMEERLQAIDDSIRRVAEKGAPRRTVPTAAACASRTDSDGEALAAYPTSVRLVAPSRSLARQRRAARGEHPAAGVSAAAGDDDATAREVGRSRSRSGRLPQSHRKLLGGTLSVLSGHASASYQQ